MKDHEIRETINELRDIAKEFHAYEQLRDRIARVVSNMVKKVREERGIKMTLDEMETIIRAHNAVCEVSYSMRMLYIREKDKAKQHALMEIGDALKRASDLFYANYVEAK